MAKLKHIKDWYETYDRRISMGSLLLGFVVDALTLQRIDALRENLWIAFNILVVALSIILLNRKRSETSYFWFSNILQFSFGALLGSFFIFYFRSATLSASWPFLLILLVAMVANELFQKKYARLAFQLSLFYFSLFSFSIFLMPLLVKDIGPEIFVLSGGVSLFFLWLYIFILHYFIREKFLESRTHIWSFVTVIFVGINLLYFTNLIPPIPLSLKDSGIYHSITRDVDGKYIVSEEVRGWDKYLPLHPRIHWREGEPLYAYTAIFSPGSLNTDVVHVWQYQKEDGEWVTATRIPLYLSGGRTSGFRIFSTKSNLSPGSWRVNVETKRGELIGRITFKIIPVNVLPALVTSIKN